MNSTQSLESSDESNWVENKTSCINTVTEKFFLYGHYFSVIPNEFCYCCYKAVQEVREYSSFLDMVKKAFVFGCKLIFAIGALPVVVSLTVCSLLFSSLGAICMKMNNKCYIYEELSSNKPPFVQTANKTSILQYNTGFLPGRLLAELTVGKFSFSHVERMHKIAEYISNKMHKEDIVFLEEAMDMQAVQIIKDRCKELPFPVHAYYRITANPVKPGIVSGLMILSKRPLNIKVDAFSITELFFNRCYVSFPLFPDVTIVHTHLSANDKKYRFQQLQDIVQKFSGQKLIIVGDCNFLDEEIEAIQRQYPQITLHVKEKTMRLPEKNGETRPDWICSIGLGDYSVETEVDKSIQLSDHYPVEGIITKKEIDF